MYDIVIIADFLIKESIIHSFCRLQNSGIPTVLYFFMKLLISKNVYIDVYFTKTT